jgi:hypothetical protein
VQRRVLMKWLAMASVALLPAVSSCNTAPEVAAPPNATPDEREFDQGSRIEARELTQTQVANLALLGKVWGFAIRRSSREHAIGTMSCFVSSRPCSPQQTAGVPRRH